MLTGNYVGNTKMDTAGEVLMSSMWDSWQGDGGSCHVLTAQASIFVHSELSFVDRGYKLINMLLFIKQTQNSADNMFSFLSLEEKQWDIF